ncbi:MAG: hypothetical protein CMJ78_20345 [Planctomycetaceae bacterium]|nr:hypothetical protein [Planctomycetaceae bacterium]
MPYDFDQDIYDGDPETRQATNDLVNDFRDQGKFVTAICNGVTALSTMRDHDGNSLLEGRTVSAFSEFIPRANGQWYTSRSLVESNGATHVPSGSVGDPTTRTDDVIVDGMIITAENWNAACRFGEVIAEQLYLQAVDEAFTNNDMFE